MSTVLVESMVENLIDRIEHEVQQHEKLIEKEVVRCILLCLIEKQLRESRRTIDRHMFPDIDSQEIENVSNLFDLILAMITTHTDSPELQKHILGRLLVWVASEIALSYGPQPSH